MLLWELLIVDIAPAFNLSLTSLQLSTFPLQQIKPLLLAKRLPGSSAYSAQWPLHCGGVWCSAASCFFPFCFTVHKVSNHGVAWRKVLMVFWSTSFKSHLLFSYECVECISTSFFVCHNYSPSVVLPLKSKTCVWNTFTKLILLLLINGHIHCHIEFTFRTTVKQCVKDLPINICS